MTTYTLDAIVDDVYKPRVDLSLSPSTRSHEAYERLRAMVFGGELPAGSHITEALLVRQLGMSRTPVREALTRLAAEGQLVASPGRGFIVVEVSPRDLIDIYAVRARLEGLAAETAAADGLSRVDLARLEDLYEAMDEALQRDDNAELSTLNSEFHRVIGQASGNGYLLAMLDDIRDVFDRFRTTALTLPGRRDEAHHEHGLLLAALRDGDSTTACRLADHHVKHALEARRKIFDVGRADHVGSPEGAGNVPASPKDAS